MRHPERTERNGGSLCVCERGNPAVCLPKAFQQRSPGVFLLHATVSKLFRGLTFKPCSRIMRELPYQSDQQDEEAYNQLLMHEEEDGGEEEETPLQESFMCEESPCKQILSSNPSSISSNSTSPQLEQLPTFVAPQGLHSFQLPLKEECRRSQFAKYNDHGRHLVPLCESQVCTQSFRDSSFPASDFCQHLICSSIHSMRQSKPRKVNLEQHDYAKQKVNSYKKSRDTDGGIYDLALDQTMSMCESRGEKKRHSSACARDMIRRKDTAMLKNRFCDVQPYSWEEEVRQAMAKSSLSNKPNNTACKGGSNLASGLQRSSSIAEQHESSALPSTLIMKRADNAGNVNVGQAICAEEHPGVKGIQDPGVGGCVRLPNKGVTDEKRMWKGFNVVKSPSEERWEEAAQDEERQELLRRVRSQSLRYDTHLRASDITGIGKPHSTNVFYNDEASEWAVYTRSGYVSVRPPRKSDADASSTCCGSLVGRSMSMRDTRMGLVMECAACGTALHGVRGHLLCFCACCAAARSSTTSQATSSAQKKKGVARGIFRACRRLLGLSKKHSGPWEP